MVSYGLTRARRPSKAAGISSPALPGRPFIPTLEALLIDELKDLYSAENQLLQALPKMAKIAANPSLKRAFIDHFAQSAEHVMRLVQSLKLLRMPPKGNLCYAMLGLLEEGGEAVNLRGPAAVRDAALIGAAQRVEHYEIAAYGTTRAFAQLLGEDQVAELLQETLDEEGEMNQRLTLIARIVNAAALKANEEALLTRQ